MFTRVVLALVVAIVVGLLLTALLGPILAGLGIPLALVVGDFFIRYGWAIGVLAGLWHFFSGGTWGWPHP